VAVEREVPEVIARHQPRIEQGAHGDRTVGVDRRDLAHPLGPGCAGDDEDTRPPHVLEDPLDGGVVEELDVGAILGLVKGQPRVAPHQPAISLEVVRAGPFVDRVERHNEQEDVHLRRLTDERWIGENGTHRDRTGVRTVREAGTGAPRRQLARIPREDLLDGMSDRGDLVGRFAAARQRGEEGERHQGQ
jgi:hypothetical protein